MDKWISVEDRLPEDSVDVLLYETEFGDLVTGSYDEDTKVFEDSGAEIIYNVTHWQPLPEPPDQLIRELK